MISKRIQKMQKELSERGEKCNNPHFSADRHYAALHHFSDLPRWEKHARSMAYAIEHQEVYARPSDEIGGMIHQFSKEDIPVPQKDPDFDADTPAKVEFLRQFPKGETLLKNQLIGTAAKGHICWDFSPILELGTEGFLQRIQRLSEIAPDRGAKEFYQGAQILLEAMQSWNDRHIEAYHALGKDDLAERMKKVPRKPAETFLEAVQAFYIQHLCVMAENPCGGNGPGQLDRYLWPYLEKDLAAGRCTLEKAKEIIDELFLKFEERLLLAHRWVEAIVVGGTLEDGRSAVNPLTYIMVQSVMDLDILHPSVYLRIPKDAPEELWDLAAKYLCSGNNRAQILYDPTIMEAMIQNGTEKEDAANYVCGGCMEISVQGGASDFLYVGWMNTAKILELMITGGICLKSGKPLDGFLATKSLAHYLDFESFYQDFIQEAHRLTHLYLKKVDIYSSCAESARPSYLVSSLIHSCLDRGRTMHQGGARYHDYGLTHLAIPNVADGLYAIKKAVFEEKICSAEELIQALKADFKGFDSLQTMLRALPKFGQDCEEVDTLAAKVAADFSKMLLSYENRHGGHGKPVILTFTYAPQAATILGATADGRRAGSYPAHGITPHSGSMTEGITAAINSCCKMPFETFSGGASAMWDLDPDWATPEIAKALLKTFFQKGGQIFQGNTTSIEDLLEAQKRPQDFNHLMVRVGGYSARFITLSEELQDEIISRYRHKN